MAVLTKKSKIFIKAKLTASKSCLLGLVYFRISCILRDAILLSLDLLNFKTFRVEGSLSQKAKLYNPKIWNRKVAFVFDFVCFTGCHFTQPGFTQISIVGILNFLAFLTCLMVPIKISCHLSRHIFLLHGTLNNYTVIRKDGSQSCRSLAAKNQCENR